MVSSNFIESLGWDDVSNWSGTKTFERRENIQLLEDGIYFDSLIILRLRENFENGDHITIRKYQIHRKEEEYKLRIKPNKFKKEYLFQGWIETEEEFKNLMKQLRIK